MTKSMGDFGRPFYMEKFKIKGDHIELIQLLKVLGIADTGGQAKFMVEDGLVKVNGEVETRKRAKLRIGDKVDLDGDVFEME